MRVAEKTALANILAPLTRYALEVGVSARDLQIMCRTAVVQSAANRQCKSSNRLNISGISAATGIPRAEVSRILTERSARGLPESSDRPHAINKIISVWNESPQFNIKGGHPADLKIYGSGRTFESLARKHGGGLPVRALLDELLRTGLVELAGAQKVKLRSSVLLYRGFNARELKLLSQKVAQLVQGMFEKILKPDSQFIISNIEAELDARAGLPVLRKEFTSGSDDFLTGFRENLFRYEKSKSKVTRRTTGPKIRVTVLYQEEPINVRTEKTSIKRKNFRRLR